MGRVEIASHSSKTIIVTGDTREVKDILKALGGRWIRSLSGWTIFSEKKEETLEALRKTQVEVLDCTGAGEKRAVEDAQETTTSKKLKAESMMSGDIDKKTKTDDKGSQFIELSSKRRITVNKYQGNVLVDFREYYETDGEFKPGKKGISLSVQQWEATKRSITAIDEAIANA